MTTLAELKVKADNLGLDRGIVRLYGDLRKIETWERAITSHQTVTVEAETIIDEVEIIPFTHDQEVEVSDDEITEVVETIYSDMREVFAKNAEAIANLPPAPPPLIINVPAERRDIPPNIPDRLPSDIEIAENDESPSPGIGRGDERFKNLGDRLGEKIKADVFKYLDSIRRWIIEQFDYFDVSHRVNEFQSIHKTEIKIFEFIEQAIKLVTRIKEKQIPWYLQKDIPAPPVWFQIKQDDYFLLLERPGPIPTLSIDYGGEFIPNCYHGLGIDFYCWKFPNQLRAEEFFELIERATNYIFLPASQPQLLLAGV